MRFLSFVSVSCLFLTACGAEPDPVNRGDGAATVPRAEQVDATALASGSETASPEDLERGRMDPSWRRYVQLDTLSPPDSVGNLEQWEEITAQALNSGRTPLPLSGDIAGPSVARLQILLDRALFSPGLVDGRWGKNTEKAVYWLQKREGLPATGRVDRQTFERLVELAGSPQQIARTHQLTADDVAGPFVEIPEDIYAKAELECLCYTSVSEKVAELFHTSPELLAQLNPGVDLDQLAAGTELEVPNVRGDYAALERLNTLAAQEGNVSPDSLLGGSSPDIAPAPTQTVARIVISDGGHYVHALDASGRILYHFPSTLGSDYAPSPTGDYRVTSVTYNPWWHYQPALLTGVPDHEEDARIPPGPNNAVGIVWMDLSKPHYGIHGTSAPETIGYATSHGCVRLTNWDAWFLSQRVSPETPVEFRNPA